MKQLKYNCTRAGAIQNNSGDFMTKTELKRELELYKNMYHRVFNAATDVIRISEDDTAKRILIKAQQDAEEIYING